MKKKLFSILLSLAMVITMMPMATMTAFAGTSVTVSPSVSVLTAQYGVTITEIPCHVVSGTLDDGEPLNVHFKNGLNEDVGGFTIDIPSSIASGVIVANPHYDITWFVDTISIKIVQADNRIGGGLKYGWTYGECPEREYAPALFGETKFVLLDGPNTDYINVDINQSFYGWAKQLKPGIYQVKAYVEETKNYKGVSQVITITVEEPSSPSKPTTPSVSDADKKAFDEYKITAKTECDKLLRADDSDAVKKLVTDAKTAIDNTKYDSTKSLEDNEAVIAGIVSELKQNVMEQRADEELTRIAKITKMKVTKVKAIKKGKIKLTYKSADSGLYVAKYQIYKSTKKASGFKKIATTTKKTYTDTKNLKKGKKYYYKVRGMVKLSTGKYTYTAWSSVKSVKAK